MKNRLKTFTDSLTNSVKPTLTAAHNSINTGLEDVVEVSSKTKESLSSGLVKSTEIVADSFEVLSSNVGESFSELKDSIQQPFLDSFPLRKDKNHEAGSKEELEMVIEKLKKKGTRLDLPVNFLLLLAEPQQVLLLRVPLPV